MKKQSEKIKSKSKLQCNGTSLSKSTTEYTCIMQCTTTLGWTAW